MITGLIKGAVELGFAMGEQAIRLGIERTKEIVDGGDGFVARTALDMMPRDGDLMGAIAVPTSVGEFIRANAAIGLTAVTFVAHGLPYGMVTVAYEFPRAIAGAFDGTEEEMPNDLPKIHIPFLSRTLGMADASDACTA